MTTAQLNTRLDENLKRQGDAALAQAGYTPSQAIRAVWEYAADHAHEPHVIRELLQKTQADGNSDRKARIAEKQAALKRGLRLYEKLTATTRTAMHPGTESASYDDLRETALNERWKERGLL